MEKSKTHLRFTRLQRYLILSLIPLYFIVAGFALNTPEEIRMGLLTIVREPDILITDYIQVGGIGAAFVNASLLMLLSIWLCYFLGKNEDGHTITAACLMFGFSLFGKNIMNIWAILAGTWLYARYHRTHMSRYIYVALYGDIINAQPISITAKTDLGVYRKTAASVTLASGKTYTTTGLALSSAVASNAVEGDIGKLIGADGNIYPKADIATAFGTSGVAMIGYVGTESDCTHGIAVALNDESNKTKMELSEATATCAAKDAVTDCTWRLPSRKDWQYLFIGCGSNWTYTDSPSGSIDCSDLQSALVNAGGRLMNDRYLCTEGARVDFTETSASFGFTSNPWYVRAVLAF